MGFSFFLLLFILSSIIPGTEVTINKIEYMNQKKSCPQGSFSNRAAEETGQRGWEEHESVIVVLRLTLLVSGPCSASQFSLELGQTKTLVGFPQNSTLGQECEYKSFI